MGKKVNYLMFDGVKYEAVEQEKNISGACDGCCFLTVDGVCAMPGTDGFSISCDDGFIFVNEWEVAAQQRLTERSEKELDLDNPIAIASDKVKIVGQGSQEPNEKVKRPGAIGKRSYYSFPNGVEAEDICRYLSFNLGNVVKYVCRAGRKDPKKKALDLRKAMDYLENEIKRMEEEDD